MGHQKYRRAAEHNAAAGSHEKPSQRDSMVFWRESVCSANGSTGDAVVLLVDVRHVVDHVRGLEHLELGLEQLARRVHGAVLEELHEREHEVQVERLRELGDVVVLRRRRGRGVGLRQKRSHGTRCEDRSGGRHDRYRH